MAAASGNIYQGLWYPIAVAAMTLAIGSLFLCQRTAFNIHRSRQTRISRALQSQPPPQRGGRFRLTEDRPPPSRPPVWPDMADASEEAR
jgi:hypothetical protein